ncbi:uncharacterized protein [Panulirus ornatus]|uniref:uncharacterized protein isoform X2 n=1 Tax=Panulirus ornatus TaxID=150431 RepID=UPI003A872D9B
MSLIRIRGRTILTPILSEEERVEVRALRERAIQFQNERQELQRQQHVQCRVYHHQRENQHKTWGRDRYCIGPGYQSSGSEKVSSGCTTDRSTRASPSVTHNKHLEGPETSSSSGPSSHGSGEPTSEGPEDSPSAANVSVQTESSLSLTASTDLRSYLNTSLDNSLDTSVSASLDTWQHSPSLAEVDEALLLSGSPEVATNLILGRLHPSSVLKSTAKLQSSGADSQHTETASTTLVQGQQTVERHTTSECQDTATIASLSLSFASVSEEGGEGSGDGLEVSEEILEVSEDVIDGSEEDRTGSLPSEVESDSHREDDNQRYITQMALQQVRSPRTSISDVGKGVRDGGVREASSARVREVRDGGLREKRDIGVRDLREASWMSQRDSGRSSSHSDYLDDYLEQLTSRCGSGLGLEAPVLSVTTCKSAVPVTTSTSSSRHTSSSGTETSNHGSFSSHFGMNVPCKQKEKEIDSSEACHGKSVDKRVLSDHKESLQSSRKTEVCQGKNLEKGSSKESNKEMRSPRELHRTRDILAEPRSSSAASERRVSKRSRTRRWSSDQPLDPGRSVGSKYLDSYLGNLTDDAWLQYPTQLASRRMVFLNSDEYIHSVRPQVKKKQEDDSSTKDHSGSSASEESRKLDTSTTSSTDPFSSEEMSHIHSYQESRLLTNNQDLITEAYPEKPQLITQTPAENLDLDSQSIQSISSSSKSLQKNEVTDLSLEAQEGQDISLHEAPETPSDKTETKVSSDEGIEVLGSPASTGSDGKLDEVRNSKSPSEEEVPVVDNKTEVVPPSSSQFAKFSTSQDSDSLETKVPTLKTDESLGCVERNEECLESSSEDSSETEPSTIVYVEDCPIESLNEGQKNSSMDSEERIKSQVEGDDQGNAQMESVEQNIFQEDSKEQSSFEKDEEVIKSLGEKDSTVLSKHIMSPYTNTGGTCDEIVRHHPTSSDVQLTETAKQTEEVIEIGIQSPVTNTQRASSNDYDRKRSPDSDVYDSEEECLVVQVYDGKSIISHGEVEHGIAKLGKERDTELEHGEEVVKIVPQRRDRVKNNIAATHGMELVPERGSEDAMGQVLTLLRAKQQQELEELRLRQEEEVRQFIRQLQCVSPEQLHAFLTASTSSNTGFNGSVKDGCLSVMPQTALKTNIVVRSGVENDDTRGGNRQLRSKMSVESLNEAVVCSDSDVKVTSSTRFSLQNVENLELKLSVTPALPSQIREQKNWSGSPSCTSSNPIIVTQSHPSTHPPVTTRLPIMTFSPDTAHPSSANEKVEVESPKPRPSNHTNLMPSYFRNEEARKSTGQAENDEYIHDLNYQPFGPKNPQVTHSLHQVAHLEAFSDGSGKSSEKYSRTQNNNLNLESIDPMSLINGNCINYGDGMQYYRLCTPDEDVTISKTVPQTTSVESHYQSNPVETVTQPGLFKLLNSGPRPTSITNLLAEHPEMFREDTLEVSMECSGDWGTSEAGMREHHRSVRDDLTMAHQPPATAEGGLDMVPEKESAADVCFHRLGQNVVFMRGITRLQACIRRYMTQRLLRTKFIQEQLATLAEIAKLAQQFHRDILTDNIHKGDVDFHKALYNQEGLARERIRRVFVVLTVQEQMAFIRRDRQLWQMEQERQKSSTFRSSPTHTSSSRNKNRNIEDRPRPAVATKTSEKRPSPTGSRIQQDTKSRAVSHKGRTSRLVQPSVIHHASPSHTSTAGIHSSHRLSPRVSRLPVQMERSASHGDHSAPPHYHKPASRVKSPQDGRYGLQPSNRCPSHPRCSSASQLPSRTGSRQGSRTSGHVANVTRSMSCIARSASHSSSPQRATPPRSTSKTSIAGRRPWR